MNVSRWVFIITKSDVGKLFASSLKVFSATPFSHVANTLYSGPHTSTVQRSLSITCSRDLRNGSSGIFYHQLQLLDCLSVFVNLGKLLHWFYFLVFTTNIHVPPRPQSLSASVTPSDLSDTSISGLLIHLKLF